MNKKNVGEKARNTAAINEVVSSKKFFDIRYANKIELALNPMAIIFPNRMGLAPLFHKSPNKNGHTNGLEGSHNPAFPREKICFPIPKYTAASHHISAGNDK